VPSRVLWFVPRDIPRWASSVDEFEAPVLGKGSWCHARPTNRDNRFSSSLYRLSLASREETGAPLGPACDVDLRADRRLLGGRGDGGAAPAWPDARNRASTTARRRSCCRGIRPAMTSSISWSSASIFRRSLLRLAAEPRPGFGTGWESGSGTDSTAMPSCRYAVRLCCSRSGVSSHERVSPRDRGSRATRCLPQPQPRQRHRPATATVGVGETRPRGSSGELGRSA